MGTSSNKYIFSYRVNAKPSQRLDVIDQRRFRRCGRRRRRSRRRRSGIKYPRSPATVRLGSGSVPGVRSVDRSVDGSVLVLGRAAPADRAEVEDQLLDRRPVRDGHRRRHGCLLWRGTSRARVSLRWKAPGPGQGFESQQNGLLTLTRFSKSPDTCGSIQPLFLKLFYISLLGLEPSTLRLLTQLANYFSTQRGAHGCTNCCQISIDFKSSFRGLTHDVAPTTIYRSNYFPLLRVLFIQRTFMSPALRVLDHVALISPKRILFLSRNNSRKWNSSSFFLSTSFFDTTEKKLGTQNYEIIFRISWSLVQQTL